ncbi:S8 family peptidase [Actinokineospora inagensis]|uniref:S8 family peptidase n=1 Tax=Actinokineospora inagensis TaxID=103730 RepID=UPI0003FE009D|nr:S8 family serine peptidase [Actinokineospora inagensis]
MRIRGTAATTTTTLAIWLTATAGPVASAQVNTVEQAAGATTATTVTLITGDRIALDQRQRPLLQANPKRAGIRFQTYTHNGDTYVIPLDAEPLVRSGQLDRRLFDVTELLRSGYDDRRGDLPLIQTGPSTRGAGIAPVRELPSAKARALKATKSDLAGSWRSLVSAGGKVWLDRRVPALLDRSAKQIGAPEAWQQGITGTGVKVAVVDTGIDKTHPDLAGREVAEQDFTQDGYTDDVVGHGTHVASIIAGGGAKYRGIANGASLINAKVLDHSGGGELSWIIAGIEWSVDQGARVVNLSLGADDSPEIDPLEETVNRLSADKGTLFVVAAGNAGRPKSIGSPGSADAALTVGSVERDDTISDFSSRGPRNGDNGVKPDITAPGSGIVAAKATNGQIGDPAEPGYVSLSGTSMASPHVAGAAALLLQQHPGWTGQQVKAALTASAKPTAGAGVFDQGSGRVDVAKSLTQTLTSEPTSVSLGSQLWPHNDDTPVTRDLSYHNSATTAVTLDLAVDATGPDGKPATLFTVSPARITVPAGGSAAVKVTGDARKGTADGPYTGAIVATGGGQSLRTPVALSREIESYDTTVRYLGPDGKPSTNWSSIITGIDTDYDAFPYPDQNGLLKVRLPKGRYVLSNLYFAPDNQLDSRLLAYPALDITKAGEIVVDARATAPVTITAPDPKAPAAFAVTGYNLYTPDDQLRFGLGLVGPSTEGLRVGQVGPNAPADQLLWGLSTGWGEVNPTADQYTAAWFQDGSVPHGFTKTVSKKDLARIKADIGSTRANPYFERYLIPFNLAGKSPLLGFGGEVAAESTAYVNTDNILWEGDTVVGTTDTIDGAFYGEPFRPRAGQTYRQPVNHGIFGPSLPRATTPWAERNGPYTRFTIGLWGDGDGNAGFARPLTATTTLSRDGVTLGHTDLPGAGVFKVPTTPGTYRLTTTATRDPAISPVATAISATWTFHSDAQQKVIPLATIRFHGTLRNDNTAPPGHFTIPVALQLENGTETTPKNLSVEVSYDEGKTWQKARVTGCDLHLDHPRTATTVSLRAHATAPQGGTIDQTTIRAYLIKK